MSFLDGKQKAKQVEELYSRHELVIPSNSYLGSRLLSRLPESSEQFAWLNRTHREL